MSPATPRNSATTDSADQPLPGPAAPYGNARPGPEFAGNLPSSARKKYSPGSRNGYTIMKRYIHHDVFISLVLIAFSVVFLWTSKNFPDLSGVFPQFFLVVLIVLAAIVLYRAVKESARVNDLRAKGEEVSPDLTLSSISLPMQGWACVLAYSLAIHYIGFFVSTTVFMVLFMLFLGIRKWPQILLPTIGTDVFLYLLFVRQLKLSLPSGLLL